MVGMRWAALVWLCAAVTGLAQEVLVHFELGSDAGVTYAAAGSVLETKAGQAFDLARHGDPVFFASAPPGLGGGAILFDGKEDGYVRTGVLGSANGDFILEAWANARKADANALQGVVALGNGGLGYSIARQGDEWVAYVGGVGPFTFSGLKTDQWVHLALVARGDDCALFRDGVRVGEFRRTARLVENFAIGCIEASKHEFHGLIHSVRLSKIGGEGFDPARDLLIDGEALQRRIASDLKRRSQLIEDLGKSGVETRLVNELDHKTADKDWLAHRIAQPVELQVQIDENQSSARLLLTNGIASRTFYVGDNLACISFRSLRNGAEFLRAVKPEVRVQIDGNWYDVGGLRDQPEMSYLLEAWLPQMSVAPSVFRFAGMRTSPPQARYPWKKKFNAQDADWPPKGLHLELRFEAPTALAGPPGDVEITIHYEMYEGLPVVSKWFTLNNDSSQAILIDAFESEHLAVPQDQVDRLHVESDYAFAIANMHPEGSALMHFAHEPESWEAGRSTTDWRVDREYHTWATANPTEDGFLGYPHRCLLVSRPPTGPGMLVEAGGEFGSFRTFELLSDSDDRERRTLGQRRMYRKVAPQVTESLLTAAITSQDPEKIKAFMDQAGELGFERIDIHPWPGISHDNLDPEYVAKWKGLADYARERGMILGGYELAVASRGRGAEHDCVDPRTGKPGSMFGQSVCIATEWGDAYFDRVLEFIDKTGIGSWNADGPYHGDACASESHAHHRGLWDSQWRQWQKQVSVIHQMQGRGMYLPLPEWYFLNGQSATSMGYREASANLTPQQQLLLGRQYIYDGTWHKLPTMGWMTLQLVGFYTNDPRVGLEPLRENLDRYERGLVQHLGSGCQFTLRGNRLYDCDETKAMVRKWVEWFRKHREILTSEIIHVGRPTGRGLDCILHVNPHLKERGLAVVFNPTDRQIKEELRLPLYYAGLDGSARIREADGAAKVYTLDRQAMARVSVTLEANGFTWLLVEEGR